MVKNGHLNSHGYTTINTKANITTFNINLLYKYNVLFLSFRSQGNHPNNNIFPLLPYT